MPIGSKRRPQPVESLSLSGEKILSATIIVGEPNPLLDGIHDRMPVMLLPDDYDRWLDPAMSVDELRAMLKPYDANLMNAYEVSRAVNSVKNDTPECVEPQESILKRNVGSLGEMFARRSAPLRT